MNEPENSNPAQPVASAGSSLPPVIPHVSEIWHRPGEEPLGTDSVERTAVPGVIGAVEAMLRQPRRVMYQLRQPGSAGLSGSLVLVAVLCSLVYGVVVGTFSGGEQLWAAPAKIVLGMAISALICLPSLYIFSCLSGSSANIKEVFGLVTGLLALMTVLLVGFAPVAWVFSQSTKSLVAMGGLHLVFWLVAVAFGIRFLSSGFRNYSARSPGGIRVWVVIFLLVVLQMTTALRPIVGKSDRFLPAAEEKQFFVTHWLNCIDAESETNRGDRARND